MLYRLVQLGMTLWAWVRVPALTVGVQLTQLFTFSVGLGIDKSATLLLQRVLQTLAPKSAAHTHGSNRKSETVFWINLLIS